MKPYFIALLGLLLFVCAGSAAGSTKWIEVESPHFRVFTNGSISDARRVALNLEQLRYVFASQFPNLRLDSGAPLLVFAATDEDTARSLLPALKKAKNGQYVAGIYFHGWEKQYAMLRLDHLEVEPVYHEYVHSILHINAQWLPRWLDEGIAEFYAYTCFQNHEIYVGAPSIRSPLLRNYPLMPIEKLLSPDPKSLEGPLNENLFYAESWALVHYMTFGPGMAGGARLSRFFVLVQTGESQDAAFQQVFGSFKEMDKALEKYVRQYAFRAGAYDAPPSIDDKSFVAHTLSPAETDAQLAAFHIWTHDSNGALPLAQQAVDADPKLGLAHEDMGYSLFSQGQDAAAEKEFSQAYSLDGNLYLSLFAKTMLSPIARSDSRSDEVQFESALEKVVGLNSQFAPAFVELARLEMRENDLDSALRVSRRAEELEPGRAEYHLLTARILLRMGRDANAAEFAKFVADRWKGPDRDEAVELWNQIPVADRPAGAIVQDPPHGDLRTASGVLKSITCHDSSKNYIIALDENGKTLTFHTTNGFTGGFSDTLWYGEDHFNFCHHVDGMRAVVRFRAPSSAGYDGDFAELEIRDSFQAPTDTVASAKVATTPKGSR
jgi:tetratricopeptide (TPR) repeat protein